MNTINTAITVFLNWLNLHLALLAMGLMGACLGAILSEDKLSDRIAGFLAGIIMCIALAEPVSTLLAGGRSPEVFGFLLGAIGKSTAELLLATMRKKLFEKIVDGVDKP